MRTHIHAYKYQLFLFSDKHKKCDLRRLTGSREGSRKAVEYSVEVETKISDFLE